MPLVVPGIARFTLHGVFGPRPWANVFDMHIQSGGIGGRTDNVADQAQVFLNNWIDQIKPRVSNGCRLDGCRWVDLDTLQGTVGDAVTASGARVMPAFGAQTSEAMPPSVCFFSRKIVVAGRGKRKGRTYWPGPTENQVSSSALTSQEVTNWTTALNAFLSGVSQSGATSFGGYDSHMVVVHENAAGQVSHDDVTALKIDSMPATQRRRLRK